MNATHDIPILDIRDLPMGWDIITAPCEQSPALAVALHEIVKAFGTAVPAHIVRDGNTLSIWGPDRSPVKFWPDSASLTTSETAP